MTDVIIPIKTEAAEITGPEGRSAEEVLADLVMSDPRLQSWTVAVNSEHAIYVEYGTSPANPSAKYGKGKISPVELKIRAWLKKKESATIAQVDLDKKAHSIYRKIMRNGLAASPFFWPAVYSVLDETTADLDWIDKGHTLGEMAHMIAERAKENIRVNDSIYTGELLNSIAVTKSDETGYDPNNESYIANPVNYTQK